ncbi:MAG TPA: ATP-dependent RNA helicase HrpA, partial [Acidimicrobiales bacterium]|nr:ATP-dependent RNA helicase HrpA [Acidimicrobiales bacterium]
DRLLTAYDTLIIDEAHERSLNVDFILGYLKQLLPKRPDLKVIITSATIDTERFSRHFDDAPVVEVSGRSYPVEVRYQPLLADGTRRERDEADAICDAVSELAEEGPGDILVFCSGERDIRDAADALQRLKLRDTEVLPLFARLSMAEQHRVFQPHPGRRIVLATNVAETSITVPGVRYVVDPGTARISRYSRRTKVQRLPIEAISQASANQRAGRCGRVAPGICIRLYDEDDFESRPEFTEPEILRTNLASVILSMAAIGLGDVAAFPFVDPPDPRNIKDGISLLEELGALRPGDADPSKRLTPLGRRLARLPIDPRLGRMVIEAARNDCLREVIIIAAALSIQDPRERPTDHREAAAEEHARFADPTSDFLSYLLLWEHLQTEQHARSSSQFRKMCRGEFLNYLRVREWQDLVTQLRRIVRDLDMKTNHDAAKPDAIHLSLLSGLLSHVGVRVAETKEFEGARQARFTIAPGSALTKKPPRWVMAAELLETNQMRARTVARIQPQWLERVGAHVVKHTYGEPEWDADRGAAVTMERVTLYGLPVVSARRIGYARIDRAVARTMFIQRALVEGDWSAQHAFIERNAVLVAEVQALEARARRRNLLVPDEVLFSFFDARVPENIAFARDFDRWWNGVRRTDPGLLDFTRELLVDPALADVDARAFPLTWRAGALELPLVYRFVPGDDDGVTVHIPLSALNQVRAPGFDWHVPGFRQELAVELIRSLPKSLRRGFVPVPGHARDALVGVGPDDGRMVDVLAARLRALTGETVEGRDFDLDTLPPHLLVAFEVEDDRGCTIARSRDLPALQRFLGAEMRQAVAESASVTERSGERTWSFGRIDRVVASTQGPHEVHAYPALVDEGATVGLRLHATATEQADAMWAGTRRLLLLSISSPKRGLERLLPNDAKLAVAMSSYESLPEVMEECVASAVDDLMEAHGGPAWDETSFAALRDAVARELPDLACDAVVAVGGILITAAGVQRRLADLPSPATLHAVADITAQLAGLVHDGFIAAAGARRLPDIHRYVQAMERRLDKLAADIPRDRERTRRIQRLEDEYLDVVEQLPEGERPAAAHDVRWMLEELRVSWFAQVLGTSHPVSEERVRSAVRRLAV